MFAYIYINSECQKWYTNASNPSNTTLIAGTEHTFIHFVVHFASSSSHDGMTSRCIHAHIFYNSYTICERLWMRPNNISFATVHKIRRWNWHERCTQRLSYFQWSVVHVWLTTSSFCCIVAHTHTQSPEMQSRKLVSCHCLYHSLCASRVGHRISLPHHFAIARLTRNERKHSVTTNWTRFNFPLHTIAVSFG